VLCTFTSFSFLVYLNLSLTDGQSAILSLDKAPIWGLRPDFYCCLTVAGLLMWGVLSDKRTGLSFAIAAGPRQRSHSRVHFTVSVSKLPFSWPPTTRRATVEVFDPATTWGSYISILNKYRNVVYEVRDALQKSLLASRAL
jgi:hypothetical protein